MINSFFFFFFWVFWLTARTYPVRCRLWYLYGAPKMPKRKTRLLLLKYIFTYILMRFVDWTITWHTRKCVVTNNKHYYYFMGHLPKYISICQMSIVLSTLWDFSIFIMSFKFNFMSSIIPQFRILLLRGI